MTVRSTRALRTVGPLLAALLVGGGCGEAEPVATPTVSAPTALPDDVNPSSLIEGPLVFMGMRMPLRTTLARHTPTMAMYDVPFGFEQTANYFRARLETSSIDLGPRATTFNDATVKGSADGHRLKVRVLRKGQNCKVIATRVLGPTPLKKGTKGEWSLRPPVPPDAKPPQAGPDGGLPPRPSEPMIDEYGEVIDPDAGTGVEVE